MSMRKINKSNNINTSRQCQLYAPNKPPLSSQTTEVKTIKNNRKKSYTISIL
jgi:hypothetical protein